MNGSRGQGHDTCNGLDNTVQCQRDGSLSTERKGENTGMRGCVMQRGTRAELAVPRCVHSLYYGIE